MNASEISAALAERAQQVAEYLLPDGKKEGEEWKAGSTDGGSGRSLGVRLSGSKRGVWADFASGQGGDLLDLWSECRRASVSEAMREAAEYLGVSSSMPKRAPKSFQRPDRSLFKKASTTVVDWLKSRGLTDETIAAFKIVRRLHNGTEYAVFPYLKGGALVNAKWRNPAQKKDMRQEAGAEPCLFGWHLVSDRARTVAITEGELDAMTLWQMGVPALSVNAGAGNHQWIESDWDELQRFSTIYICFDDDEPGQKGAKEVASRLGIERCRIVRFGAKDANQWLQDGATSADFIKALSEGKPLDPEELRPMSDFMEGVKALFYPTPDQSASVPQLRFGATRCQWFDFRPGELTVWTGYNGHGKSLALSQVLLGVAEQGLKVCVFSGEMLPEYQGKRLVKQATGIDRPTPEYIDAVGGWMQDKFWIFNVTGATTVDRLCEVFLYASRRYGIKHFVVDSLMMTDVPEDGRDAHSRQKDAVQKLTRLAKQTRGHVHLVAHPRKGKDEDDAPGKMDVAGSSKITDGADNVFTVWSARREADEDPDKPDAYVELQKQRNGDTQKKKLWLWFDRGSYQYSNSSKRVPYRYVGFNRRLPTDSISMDEGDDGQTIPGGQGGEATAVGLDEGDRA